MSKRRVAIAFALFIAGNVSAQNLVPSSPAPQPAGATAEVERVIVTGSNIPTAEEVGPNPVDTYRAEDIQKLGAHNATDLLIKLPQEMGSTINQNIANGGDGSVIPNLRGLLPKETLVLVDGKRVAPNANGVGVDINLIPFPMIDHIDILKDGASAIYGSDAVAGVINIFLKHKFRGLEIGGSIGNTNLGASNDARETEAWMIAGTGDEKTDILIIADAYDRQAIFSRDRNLTSNTQNIPWGGIDFRSDTSPGKIQTNTPADVIGTGVFILRPGLAAPTPHSAPNAQTSPEYIPRPFDGHNGPFFNSDFFAYSFTALTPAIPENDRQSFYGSFTRDLCDKYLTVFADFKYTRSFFNAELAPTPFFPDPFKRLDGSPFSPAGISVPTQNAFNPFTVADTTLPTGTPFAGIGVTTGVKYRALEVGNRTSPTTKHDMLFDFGLKGQMGEFGDYFKTWNWELGFRYSRDEAINLSEGVVSKAGLREALLDTDPATAFNPFLNFSGVQQQTAIARSRVYVTLHSTAEFELPLSYFTVNGDLFNLPAGPVSFAAGLEYHGERWENTPDSLNTSFNSIGSQDFEASRVNRDVWTTYQEVRIPVTSPAWKFPGAYSLEFDIAEREEWYSQNTSTTTVLKAQHSQFDAQKPKFSVRWQPLDSSWIGTLTLRASYSEGFHAPTLPDLTPAGTESFASFGGDGLRDPKGLTPDDTTIRVIQSGNPLLKPEVAYEWSYGAVYSPKWIKGLTLSADFWHIDLRSIASFVDAQFILDFEHSFPGLVSRDPTTSAITEIINPSLNLTRAIVEGIDYEGIYILDSSIFGHGDFGRFTFTLNGTYLSRFEFQPTPFSDQFGLSGEFVNGVSFTGSLPHTRAFVSAFYDGPADTWLAGFDVGATVHYTGQYQDDNIDLIRIGSKPRKVREWTTLDLIASYTFNLPAQAAAEVAGLAKDGGKNMKMPDGKEKNVLPASTAGYSPCGWRAWLNGTTLTLGMQNVFDSDPPFVAISPENNYDESLADVRGRFWYVQLKKRF